VKWQKPAEKTDNTGGNGSRQREGLRARLEHAALAALLAELPPQGDEGNKAHDPEHHPREFRLMQRFAGIK